MNDIELTIREFYLYVIIGGAILGALLGIIPLMLGRRRNKSRLGWYGFIATIVGGAIAPLLAVIVAAIFSWIIVKKPAQANDGTGETGAGQASDSAAE